MRGVQGLVTALVILLLHFPVVGVFFFFFLFCVISFLFDTDIVKAWKLALTRSSVLVKSSIAWRSSLFSKKEKKNIFINYKFFF